MWNTDTVFIQSKTEVDTLGSIKETWSNATAILCDVQPINKEKAYKEWGLTDSNVFLKIFAPAGSAFVEGNQISFNGEQFLIRLIADYDKINASNHMKIIASKVI